MTTTRGLADALSARSWIERDIPPRRYRDDRPVETDRTPVKVRGEKLHPVWWRGRQWAVTSFGIERLDGTYVIEGYRITEKIETWGWPAHMSGKNWVDPDDFATAWLVALALHGVTADPALIRAALGRIYESESRWP